MKRAPWLYTLMQIALWSIHGVLISYAQRYLAGMGMRDSAIGLLLGGATAAGFVLQPLLAAVCDRSRLTVRLTLLTGGGLDAAVLRGPPPGGRQPRPDGRALCCGLLHGADRPVVRQCPRYGGGAEGHAPEFRHLPRRRVHRLRPDGPAGQCASAARRSAHRAALLPLPCRHSDGHGVLLPPHGGGCAGGGDGASLRPWPVSARQPALLPAAGGRVPPVLRA